LQGLALRSWKHNDKTPITLCYNVFMKNVFCKKISYSVIYEEAPEGGYVALVPSLPGCHTQGDTIEETEKNVQEAIELYLESLEDHGE